MTLPKPLKAFISDKQGNVVLWQTPNPPLIIWFIFTVLAIVLRHTQLHDVMRIIAHVTIIIWAVLELFWGANAFRRTLGAVVVLLTATAIFAKL